jgi:hypothetical protein
MRNYQPKKNNPYKLPHNLYMRMLYLVRDYERIKNERINILHSSPCSDGLPKQRSITSPTEIKALKMAVLDTQCKAVEQALIQIPDEYKAAIINNICYGVRYPIIAHENTYGYWRKRFLYWIAQRLGEI